MEVVHTTSVVDAHVGNMEGMCHRCPGEAVGRHGTSKEARDHGSMETHVHVSNASHHHTTCQHCILQLIHCKLLVTDKARERSESKAGGAQRDECVGNGHELSVWVCCHCRLEGRPQNEEEGRTCQGEEV